MCAPVLHAVITLFRARRKQSTKCNSSQYAAALQVRQKVTEEVSVPVMLKGKQAGTLHVSLEFKGPTLTTFGQVGQVRLAGYYNNE
jgi:hypothetical protein